MSTCKHQSETIYRNGLLRLSLQQRLAHRCFAVAMASVLAASVVVPSYVDSAEPDHANPEPVYMHQGQDWTTVARADFYTRDQGSRLIPYAWLMALTQADGQPFMADQLNRYGYLPNPGNPDGLPVGFTRNDKYAGMNCAACHTRQIVVDGQAYRIDGGPAIVDAQSMFAELDDAVARVLGSDDSFSTFARKVLGPPDPTPDEIVHLKEEVQAWFLRYDTQMKQGLPSESWGPGRMDAVGMIFNRLTGLDIGPPPSHLIADNIQRADAPVRYPFLWNAAIQDMTQWPGFADNGSDILGLARNLGEVYGVFADFYPKDEWWNVLGVNYLQNNSANFDGLRRLEDLIKKLGPPKYPWPIDENLKNQGESIYARNTDQGGCVECHGITPGKTRFYKNKTWATPLMDVGTDSREYDVLKWTAKSGVLEGKNIPLLTDKLKSTDKAFNILALAVTGSIIQYETSGILPSRLELHANHSNVDSHKQLRSQVEEARNQFKLPSDLQDLMGAFNLPSGTEPTEIGMKEQDATTTSFVYESRVLEGIWATAPYLHNGSVPTLADLLEPASQRPREFKIGPNYDIDRVGLAKTQTKFGNQVLKTDPTDRNSGNSNSGHEYGTKLTAQEKKALLEYLKAL